MKNITLILLISIIFSACGETKQKDINNTLTYEHVNISGTRLFIVLPQGFEIATSFIGMQNSNSLFQIYDVIGGSFYTNAATFSKEEFEKMGATVFEYAEIKVNGFPAKYIHMQGNPDEKAISIVFGDSTFSTTIMAVYVSEDDKTGKAIQKAIQTIYYDKNLRIDPFTTASFTLDESNSIFKFCKSTAGLFLYSIDGMDNAPSTDKPLILVSTLPIDATMTLQSISEMQISSLQRNGLWIEDIQNASIIDINGLSAYETEIYGEMEGEKSMIYLLIVKGKDKAIAVIGVARSDFDNNLKEFKKLAKTIKLKT